MKNLLATAALAAAFATPAAAQIAGTYTGTSADGQAVTVYVGTDPYTSQTAIIGAGIYFVAHCKGNTGTVLTSGIGYDPNEDLVGNQVTVNFDTSNIASTFTLTFNDSTSSATGFIETAAPDLYPSGIKPKKALFCVSKKQSVNLTYQGPARVPPMAPGSFTQYSSHH